LETGLQSGFRPKVLISIQQR
jgi:hypothetical protein